MPAVFSLSFQKAKAFPEIPNNFHCLIGQNHILWPSLSASEAVKMNVELGVIYPEQYRGFISKKEGANGLWVSDWHFATKT